MSSSPVRLCTNSSPSNASSRAAMQPSIVEPKSRRPIRPIIKIARVPTTALEKRQPKELLIPKSDSPKPIIHLPTGGWTTESPYVVKTFGRAVGEERVRVLQRRLVGALDAVLPDRVALFDVVGLVEDQLVRPAELPEPQEAADGRDHQRPDPAPQTVGRPDPEQPLAQSLQRLRPGLAGLGLGRDGARALVQDRGHPGIVRTAPLALGRRTRVWRSNRVARPTNRAATRS